MRTEEKKSEKNLLSIKKRVVVKLHSITLQNMNPNNLAADTGNPPPTTCSSNTTIPTTTGDLTIHITFI